MNRLKKAVNIFSKLSPFEVIDTAIILGSGLASENFPFIKIEKVIKFNEIPYLKNSTVKGHNSEFIFGKFKDKNIVIQSGRLHLYENFSLFEIGLPIAIYGEKKTKNLIITNAAGGINVELEAGDIMMIEDHINLQGVNILTEYQPSFIDMTNAYSTTHFEILRKEFNLKKGVYIGVRGPSYETPAEIKAFKILGADAVGMSTVQEVILANYYKINVIGLSMITNKASGMQKALSHTEVIETGKKSKEKLYAIIERVLDLL
ncbi:MAG: purine-nucleoside phosphorylase [Brevinematales bacterium]|nr:purine-nucleoside phosphorylase [Brevinematales bacterium]